jgi:hypothetical protein
LDGDTETPVIISEKLSDEEMLETEVALITHLKVDLYQGTPTHSVVDSFIVSNYLVPFGPFWLQG